jgi:hypothetical protein
MVPRVRQEAPWFGRSQGDNKNKNKKKTNKISSSIDKYQEIAI